MQWSIIKENKMRDKDMKQHTMNWDQTNVTHNNQISIYSEIRKIRYEEIQWSYS